MTTLFPGPRPIHGDYLEVTTKKTTLEMHGDIRCQGVVRDGRGFAELTLPNADPEQRRALAQGTEYTYLLYRNGMLLYASPTLTVRAIHRIDDGSLIVAGSP